MTMKPPPPMPQENGSTTPSTAAAATVASTALPPCLRTRIPAAVASTLTEATAPPLPMATACLTRVSDAASTGAAIAPGMRIPIPRNAAISGEITRLLTVSLPRSNRFERGKYSPAGDLTQDKERWAPTAYAVARMDSTSSRYRPVTFRWQPAGPFCVLLNGGYGETGPDCSAADHAIPGRAGPAGAGGASPVDDLPGFSGGQHLEHRHLDAPGPCPERPVAVLDVGGDHQLASGFR